MAVPRVGGNHALDGELVSRTVFITGVTGFVGTALARRLVREGWDVTGLVRPRSAPATVQWLTELGVGLRPGDVTDPQSLLQACAGAEVVVHCAAVIAYRPRLYGAMSAVNVEGTRAVARACLQADVGRLVHVSSVAAIGATSTPEVMDEDTPWNGAALRAPYFSTKHAAEEQIQRAVEAGLDATIVNPAAIYGPSIAVSNSSNVIARIAQGRVPAVPRGGINLVPLDTVVDGILAAARHGRRGRRTILGGENLDYRELVLRAGRAAGLDLRPRVIPTVLGALLRRGMNLVEPLVPDRVWYTPDMCALFGRWMWFDSSRAERELGVRASSIDTCLRDTVEQLRRDGRIPCPPG